MSASPPPSVEDPGPKRPAGVTLLSCFFLFGALMSGLTFFMMLFPGSGLDVLWRFNPSAREGFVLLGWRALLLLTVVCLACLTAALGLWRCSRWGLWTAVAILAINVAGDTMNAFLLADRRTLIGLPIAGLMIFYLTKQRRVFTD